MNFSIFLIRKNPNPLYYVWAVFCRMWTAAVSNIDIDERGSRLYYMGLLKEIHPVIQLNDSWGEIINSRFDFTWQLALAI